MKKVGVQATALATALKEGTPKALDEFHRIETDFAQTSMWLVGLASTLLVLRVASPDRVSAVLGHRYHAVTIALMIAIASGVLCRLFNLWLARQVSALAGGFWGLTLGYVSNEGLEIPEPLSEHWDEREIVRRLEADFSGLDYKFLLEYRVPLAGCQEAYRGIYRIWEEQEQATLDAFKKIVAAYAGYTDGQTEAMSQPVSDKTLARTRRHAMRVRRLGYVGPSLFTISALSFLVAMSLVACGLWSSEPRPAPGGAPWDTSRLHHHQPAVA